MPTRVIVGMVILKKNIFIIPNTKYHTISVLGVVKKRTINTFRHMMPLIIVGQQVSYHMHLMKVYSIFYSNVLTFLNEKKMEDGMILGARPNHMKQQWKLQQENLAKKLVVYFI